MVRFEVAPNGCRGEAVNFSYDGLPRPSIPTTTALEGHRTQRVTQSTGRVPRIIQSFSLAINSRAFSNTTAIKTVISSCILTRKGPCVISSPFTDLNSQFKTHFVHNRFCNLSLVLIPPALFYFFQTLCDSLDLPAYSCTSRAYPVISVSEILDRLLLSSLIF